jgi:alpha-glucosidase
MWWQDAVIYQVYPRSFQDSNGDGIGDLPGITKRLDHIQTLGADAIWLSPIYPSPNKDFGYDVSDYTNVSPEYGTLKDFDDLVTAAHARNLKLILDFVPCHTSIEHPWFRERPDFYFWADAPPNNWQAAFGGSAWDRDPHTGRYYLHSFFPEQADLNWRNPEVRAEMTKALEFWLARGVDGYRLDAIDRLMKDPDLKDDPPATQPFPLPLHPEYARFSHVNSANAPDIGTALNAIREAVGQSAILIGEAYLPTVQLEPYLETLDVLFAFEAMNAGPDVERLTHTISEAIEAGKAGWVLSNHDFTRFATRFEDNSRAAMTLFATLPGPLFVFQGDELGMPNGPGASPPLDRHERDEFRHPMPWEDPDSPNKGFTTGRSWLPVIAPPEGTAAEQETDPRSTLHLTRQLIALKHRLPTDDLRFRPDSPPGVLLLSRGDYTIAINLGDNPVAIDRRGDIVLEGIPAGAEGGASLGPHTAFVSLH